MTNESDPRYVLALEEARRGFDLLSAEVDAARARATTVLGMGGAAAAFLGGLSTRNGAELTVWTWIAVAAFVATAVLCGLVLLPRRFHVSQSPATIVSWADDLKADAPEMERDLALWLGEKYDANRDKVDGLGNLAALATVAFLLEVVALLIDLGTR